MAKNVKKIRIPTSARRKALVLVDIQQGFLKKWKRKKQLLENLSTLIGQEAYDLYVEVSFHAEKGSLWEKQTDWTFPYEPVVPEVSDLLKGKKTVRIIKQTRSSFKGDTSLAKILKQGKIEEIHVVGLDSNDCVFATVQEGFDLGFYSYVIEECTGASQGEKVHAQAVMILRRLGLTNHSK